MSDTQITEIDVNDLMERIRAEAKRLGRLSPTRQTANGRGVPGSDEPIFSDVLQLYLSDDAELTTQKVEDLLSRARQMTEVSSWIPKPFRGIFRKQGAFNKLLLDGINSLRKNQTRLSKQNRELRAYLTAQYYWLRDFSEARRKDRNWIRDRFEHELGKAREDRKELRRQAERTDHSEAMIWFLLNVVDRDRDEHDSRLKAVASEFEEKLAQEAAAQKPLIADLLDRLEKESQARTAAVADVLAKLEHESRAQASATTDLAAKLEQESQARVTSSTDLALRLEQENQARAISGSEYAEAMANSSRRIGELVAKLAELAQANGASVANHESLKASLEVSLEALRQHTSRLEERQINDSIHIKSELSLYRRLVAGDLNPASKAVTDKGSKRKTIAAAGASNAIGDHQFDAFYLAFENRFRGTRNEIKSRFEVYLQYLASLKTAKTRLKILDIGCGRGEWLELLKANHYVQLAGVDTNLAMAEQCRERGFKVSIADCVDYTASLKESSLNVITAFHVIEHLPFDRLMRLIAECHRILKTGGMLIFETPNPDNLIVAAKNFYIDPTHLRPLPSLLTSFLVEHAGFAEVEVVNQHPFGSNVLLEEKGELAKRFNELFYSAQDYTVLAIKR